MVKLLFGMSLALLASLGWTLIFVTLLFLVYMLNLLCISPYQKEYHNMKEALNTLIIIFVCAIYMVFTFGDSSFTYSTHTFTGLVLSLQILLLVCLIWNGMLIFHSVYATVVSFRNKTNVLMITKQEDFTQEVEEYFKSHFR